MKRRVFSGPPSHRSDDDVRQPAPAHSRLAVALAESKLVLLRRAAPLVLVVAQRSAGRQHHQRRHDAPSLRVRRLPTGQLRQRRTPPARRAEGFTGEAEAVLVRSLSGGRFPTRRIGTVGLLLLAKQRLAKPQLKQGHAALVDGAGRIVEPVRDALPLSVEGRGTPDDGIDIGEGLVHVLAVAQLALANLQPIEPVPALHIGVELHRLR
jgi:hypothetical protein